MAFIFLKYCNLYSFYFAGPWNSSPYDIADGWIVHALEFKCRYVCVCVYVCMYVCMYVFVCVCIYVFFLTYSLLATCSITE